MATTTTFQILRIRRSSEFKTMILSFCTASKVISMLVIQHAEIECPASLRWVRLIATLNWQMLEAQLGERCYADEFTTDIYA